jgi:hypothetical protein
LERAASTPRSTHDMPSSEPPSRPAETFAMNASTPHDNQSFDVDIASSELIAVDESQVSIADEELSVEIDLAAASRPRRSTPPPPPPEHALRRNVSVTPTSSGGTDSPRAASIPPPLPASIANANRPDTSPKAGATRPPPLPTRKS